MPVSHAAVALSDPSAVLSALETHLIEHEISTRRDGERTIAALPSGEAILASQAGRLSLEVQAPDEEGLEAMTHFLAAHVLEFAHPEKPLVRWSGIADAKLFHDFREMRVTRTEDLTPNMRRVFLQGEDLARFDSLRDMHVRLYFPPEGQMPQWPMRGPDGLTVPIALEAQPVMRKYTIRSIDVAKGEVAIDFVLHEAPGPGSDWARRAKSGDLCGMAGPGGRGIRSADWLLIAGDETALPAIARSLEVLPPHTRGEVLIEVDCAGSQPTLQKPESISLRWLVRGSARGTLVDAVLAVSVPDSESVFCWAGAERDAIRTIRAHWREACRLSKAQHLAVAYWSLGAPENED